ncbi:hypothetical protein Tco_0313040 [Tanacetum coccineum]
MNKSKSFDRNPKHRVLYHALMESILEDKDAMDKGVFDKLNKRKPDDAKRDEDPPAGPDQGLKRKKTSKDVEPSKKETVFKAGDSQMPQNLGKDMSKTDEPPSVKADPKNWFKKPKRPPTFDPKWNTSKIVDDISDLTKADLVRPVYNLLKGTCKGYVELEYNMEECYKALNYQLDWNNPKGDRYLFDLSKPLPLVESRNRLIVPAEYFFNNDLAYLQGGSTDRTYTTSLTKTKAAKYDLKGIEDMVPTLWSHVKVAYNKHAALEHTLQPQRRGHYAPVRSITYVHKTYCNPEASGISLTWCQKLPEEAQHLKTTDTQGWHL